jgi:peptide/nickel transport system ATP-binding protein
MEVSGEAAVLLETRHLTKHFQINGTGFSRRVLHALDDVSLRISTGEIVAVVGESGSGKSTLARSLGLLTRPTHGEIVFDGKPVHALRSRQALKDFRRSVQIVFQDPFSLAHPTYRASHGLMRALKLHRRDLDPKKRLAEAVRILEEVGLTPGSYFLRKWPFELSGGQLQRFGFAQALASGPRLVLADEPVSMLDVSIRIGILNLMHDLRRRENLAFLYITHDIASACYLADRVIVMYAGQVVETAPVSTLLARPEHPYTRLLFSAAPDPRAARTGEIAPSFKLEPPRMINPKEGCRFRERCSLAVAECDSVTPQLMPIGDFHEVACHVAKENG